jgi:hypothetical protein
MNRAGAAEPVVAHLGAVLGKVHGRLQEMAPLFRDAGASVLCCLWKQLEQRGEPMATVVGRAEMIRRLDEAGAMAAEVLANGRLSMEEQHAIAGTLTKLLPLVADSLQAQLDLEAAIKLLHDQHDEAVTARRKD